MPTWIESLGQATGGQVGAQAASEGLGLLLQPLKNKQQAKQQERLNTINANTAKELAEYNYGLEMRKWNDTNYKAQVEQMKKAGINPALIYGMGGGGGATAQTGGAHMTGTQAGTAQQSRGGEGMGLMMAQIRNMEANTAKTIAEAEKLKTVDTEKTKAETSVIKLDAAFYRQSFDQRLEELSRRIEKTLAESKNIDQNTGITGDTRNATVSKANSEALGAVLENILVGEKTNATIQDIEESKARVGQMTTQINKWSQEIAQGWKELSLKEKQIKLDAIMKEVETVTKTKGITEIPQLTPLQRRQVIDQIDEIAETGKKKK